MKILIAEDESVSRHLLETTLRTWGYDVVSCADGSQALERLGGGAAPALAILDWVMPGLDGPDVCRRVRARGSAGAPTYLILLTANSRREDIVAGLESGADDYIVKPFHPAELRARLQVGLRVIALQQALAGRVRELEAALAQVKQLQGLLPICSYCKKIRDDQNYWQQLDRYMAQHADVQFSHGICPDCYEGLVRPELERLK